MLNACDSQKRVVDSLELELLQIVVTWSVDAKNQTWVHYQVFLTAESSF